MATREQALTALQTMLAATATFKLVSRRDRSPELIGPLLSPALFLLESGEDYKRPAPTQPPVRTLTVEAILYNDVGADQNAVPLAIVNAALDALDVAMRPDDRLTGRFTLGGLVYSCMISGEVKKAHGAKTGRGAAYVPIEILLP